ncbi:arsenate reductase (glutaredoxin) [Arcobacter sp. 15-2]|uniref:arsenate reductase (glutaredoxin) n=1 Tax=Arcobacter sp. 15-2 TaxID=3374109 RepID=UPI00399CF1B3
MITIWHNNRCSKSREAKAILEESGLEFEVFEYLKNDFSKEELLRVMAQLKISDINDMLRKKEKEYKELDIGNKSQNEILDLVVQNPKLIERPIIIKENKAVIARPMENLTNLLG